MPRARLLRNAARHFLKRGPRFNQERQCIQVKTIRLRTNLIRLSLPDSLQRPNMAYPAPGAVAIPLEASLNIKRFNILKRGTQGF